MKKWFYLATLAILAAGCIQKQTIMTSDSFSDVMIGSSINEVKDVYGKPYAIYTENDGSKVFEYMEKIIMGREVLVQKKYYFVVSNEKIIGKYMKYSNPPAFQAIYSDDLYPNY